MERARCGHRGDLLPSAVSTGNSSRWRVEPQKMRVSEIESDRETHTHSIPRNTIDAFAN